MADTRFTTRLPGKLKPTTLAPIMVLALALLIAVLVVTNKPPIEKREMPKILPTVQVQAVHPQVVTMKVQAEGLVKPHKQIDLAAEIAARVTWISDNLVSGGQFAKDEPLVKLDNSDFELRVKQATATQMRTQVELDIARKNHTRQQDLFKQKLTSATKLDDAFKNFKLAEAAKLNADADLEQARQQLARTQINAPFAGRVQNESVDVGGYVKVGSPIASLYADDVVEVRLPISNEDMRFLNWPVEIRGILPAESAPPVTISSSYGGVEFSWQGALVRVESEIDIATRLFYAIAEVDNPEDAQQPPLAVGLFVQAEITGQTFDNIIVLPRSALRDNARVLVVDDTDTLRYREVSVLRIEHDQVLLNGGLQAGERVCVSPLKVVVDGMQVDPQIDIETRFDEPAKPVGEPAGLVSENAGASQ